MPYAFRKQPLKALYLVYQLVCTLFFSIPYWTLSNIPRSWRPRKGWSLKRVLMVNIVRRAMLTLAQTGPVIKIPDYQAIVRGPEVNGVWVHGANKLVTGDLKKWAVAANIMPIRIPGYWTYKNGFSIKQAGYPKAGEKVILHFHGGGYIRMSAHPKDITANIVHGYVKELESIERVFSLEYRLTSGKPFKEAHPFPTQLLDALAGYNHLVNQLGFKPENIILSGDSAGGNLAYALTRYLTEHQGDPDVENMPGPPGGLILLSPWVDMGSTTEALVNGSATRFRASDYIGARGSDVMYAKQSFSGPHGVEILETNPYISPASLHPDLVVDFKKFPKTFIVAGGAEVLYDSIVTLKERMIRDLGDEKVRYFEAPDGIHDYLVFRYHEPERTDTLKAINKWVKEL